jgi:hypothetical protein
MPDPFDDSGDFIADGIPDAGRRTRTILSVSRLSNQTTNNP